MTTNRFRTAFGIMRRRGKIVGLARIHEYDADGTRGRFVPRLIRARLAMFTELKFRKASLRHYVSYLLRGDSGNIEQYEEA